MAGRVQETADHLVTRAETVRSRYDDRISQLEQRMNPEQQQLFSTLRFLTVFAVLATPLYLLIDSGWNATTLRSVQALIAANILSLTGLEVSHAGTFLYSEQLLVDVTRDSTGWKSLLAFTALIVATGRPLKKTVYGILIGVAVIAAANLLRITSMFYAVTVYSIEYDLLHTVLWRWGLTFVVFTTWIIWLYGTDLRNLMTERVPFAELPRR